MARYHTILFDADGTLLDFHRSEEEAIRMTMQQLGITPDAEKVKKYSDINQENWRKLERGEITKGELRTARFSEFCDYYGYDHIDSCEMADKYVANLSSRSYLINGALELCRKLAPHCRLYIITNGMAVVQHGRFDPSPLAPLFECSFISDEIGAEKPSPAYFDYVLAHIPQFDAKTTLVVGDSLTSDMAGGIAAGLDTCWYNPAGKEKPADMPITYTVSDLAEIAPLILGA